MRYFFHLYNDLDVHDDEGRELPDEKSARALAEQDARDMAAESVIKGHLNLSHRIDVADETDTVRFSVRFGDVVTVTN